MYVYTQIIHYVCSPITMYVYTQIIHYAHTQIIHRAGVGRARRLRGESYTMPTSLLLAITIVILLLLLLLYYYYYAYYYDCITITCRYSRACPEAPRRVTLRSTTKPPIL